MVDFAEDLRSDLAKGGSKQTICIAIITRLSILNKLSCTDEVSKAIQDHWDLKQEIYPNV